MTPADVAVGMAGNARRGRGRRSARRWSATSDRVANACPVVPITSVPAAVAPVARRKRRRSIDAAASTVGRVRCPRLAPEQDASEHEQRERRHQTAGEARCDRPPRGGAPAALRGVGADQPERRRAGDRQPPEAGERDDAEDGGVDGEHGTDTAQQCDLVVRAEPVDRQRLDRVGHAVDDPVADVEHRRLQAIVGGGRQLRHRQPGGGGHEAGQGTERAALPAVSGSRFTPPVRSAARDGLSRC